VGKVQSTARQLDLRQFDRRKQTEEQLLASLEKELELVATEYEKKRELGFKNLNVLMYKVFTTMNWSVQDNNLAKILPKEQVWKLFSKGSNYFPERYGKLKSDFTKYMKERWKKI